MAVLGAAGGFGRGRIALGDGNGGLVTGEGVREEGGAGLQAHLNRQDDTCAIAGERGREGLNVRR